MSRYFRMAADHPTGDEDRAALRWVCHPASTGAKQLTVIDATLAHGQGHSFHSHPNQEEVLFVIAGKVEQWVDREKRILNFGDAAFIPAGMVHASFNAGEGDVRLLAILGPSVGDGFEMIDMSNEAPWKSLRA
ncbi:MAG: cupin domain-containing protein [Aestuariivirga sp.]|nr:cupin domain-containing protein [Aestuariivirga sp.]